MIEERAIVVEAHNGMMTIEVQQQSACGGCQVKSACGTSLLSSLFKQRATQLRVENSLDASAGDHVVVGIDESEMVSGSVRLYLWPLLGLIGGAIAAQTLVNPSESSAIIGGLSGMALVFWLLKQRKETLRIKVLRREAGVAVSLQAVKKT